MSITLTLEEAHAKLSELIATFTPGDEVIMTQDAKPVAALRQITKAQPRPQFGNCRGMLTVVREDKEHGADFTESMS